MATYATHKKSLAKRFWWVLCPVLLALLLAVPFVGDVKFNVGDTSISLSVQRLTLNGPFENEGVFIRTGWDAPTGSFSHGDIFGVKLGHRLLRLDIVTDPIAAAQRRLPKTLDGLVTTLDCKDHWLKFCAMRTLADMGAAAQSALPALLKALERGDPQAEDPLLKVSQASGAAALPALTNALASRNAMLREKAAEILGEIGAEARASIDLLKERLHDREPRVALHSSIGLWKIDGRTHGAVPVLVKLLAHHNPEMRAGAAAVMGEFGSESHEAVGALVHTLKDSDRQVRAMAARTLGLIGPAARPAIPRLIELLDDSDGNVLMWTIAALGQFGEEAKQAIPKLGQIARAQDSGRWAVEALGSMGTGAVPSLVEVYQDATGRNRFFAAKALMKLGPKAGAAVPYLLADLNGTNVGRVALTAQVLGHLGESARAALPRIAELLSDEEEDVRVRVRAAEALWRLDRRTNAVLPVLLAALQEESMHRHSAKRFAAEALAAMGPAAKEAVPLLETILLEQQSGLRQSAAEVLKKIAGQ